MRFPRIRPFGFRFYTTEPNSFRNLPDRSNGSSEWFGDIFLAMLIFHRLCGTVGSQLVQEGGGEAQVSQRP